MTDEEIIRYWGKPNLRKWNTAVLDGIDIREDAKWFLANVGFPIRQDWILRFDHDVDDLPPLEINPRYRVFGHDDFVPICIEEGAHGFVHVVEDPTIDWTRFVNSSIRQFGEFLILYSQYRHLGRTMDDVEVKKLVAKTEVEMKRIDDRAFWADDDYWPLIIEQMQEGLL